VLGIPEVPVFLETFVIVTLGAIGVLLLANLVLVVFLLRAVTQLRRTHEEWAKRLDTEIGESDPARAAVAAVLATSPDKPVTPVQFEKEMAALMEQWQEIERLADKAHDQLDGLLERGNDVQRE